MERVVQNLTIPCFESQIKIPVEFLILHYTACSLFETLRIFFDPVRRIGAHFVIDRDGTIYDLGKFLYGEIYKGAHAGQSFLKLEKKNWENFNLFSIGIELINFNGNIFDYTQDQYTALIQLTRHLCVRFPVLRDPRRILGHEHIAGWRGKVDPGSHFNWPYFFSKIFNLPLPLDSSFNRPSVLTSALKEAFELRVGKIPEQFEQQSDWAALNTQLETFIREELNGY